MFARKISKITIQSNVHEFYEIKDFFLTKKKCMICKKKKTLTITETNRTLTVVCTTPGCKGNMTIPVGTFITYDALYAIRKTKYMNSVNAILRGKFDTLFNLDTQDLSEMKDDYLNTKLKYDKMFSLHDETVDRKKETLNAEMNLFMDCKHAHNCSSEELNGYLDKMRELSYTKVGTEVIRATEFAIDIPVL